MNDKPANSSLPTRSFFDHFGRFALVRWTQQAWHGVLDLLVPRRCNFCGSDLKPQSQEKAPLLCRACTEQFVTPATKRRCSRCGKIDRRQILSDSSADSSSMVDCPNCCTKQYRFDRVLTLGDYDATLRDAVLRMKHRAGDCLAHSIGDLLAQDHGKQIAQFQPDVIVPIPMHWWRRTKRGTNSPEIIASRISRHLGVPFETSMLIRHRSTVPQARLSPTKRLENVRGAFRLRRGYDIKDARVLLIDDILTTGATCNEAAKILKQAGAHNVLVAVVARTDRQA